MNNIIDKALKYTKDFFKNEYSGHDYFHTLRVYNNAIQIAKKDMII